MGQKSQLELFPSAETATRDDDPPGLAEARSLAARLPGHVRLGTSSWTFPGWVGIVYPEKTHERELLDRGLELYTRYPLFRTVGIDRSYYRPLSQAELEQYRAQLPPGFRCVVKVWSEITSAVHRQTREPNRHFLDASLFSSEVLEPLERNFRDRLGPLLFEFTPLRRGELPDPLDFAKRIAGFFEKLPKGFEYAVELRNRELFTSAYLDVLQAHGVAHVLNFWERMPTLGEQLAVPGVLTAPFAVARLLIPPGQRYADRRAELEPFDRIVEPQLVMRDDVVRLSEACAALGKVLFVVVNNKAEGSSPLSVRALAERLASPSEGRLQSVP